MMLTSPLVRTSGTMIAPSETGDRLAFVLVDLEDLRDLRQGQQVSHFPRRPQNLDPTTVLVRPLVASDQLPEPGAVHEAYLLQRQDDPAVACIEQVLDLLSQLGLSLADRDLARKLQDLDRAYRSSLRLHGLYPFLALPDPVTEPLVQGYFRPLSFVLVDFHAVDERLHQEQPPATRLKEVLRKRRIGNGVQVEPLAAVA